MVLTRVQTGDNNLSPEIICPLEEINEFRTKKWMMKIKEVTAKSIVVQSQIPDLDYVVNPYTGCQHGCKYCYAKFMKYFTNHHEPWGKFVDVKVNASELIGDSKYKEDTIQLSSVTDPYQPLEKKYEITRKTLRELIGSQASIDILTKSNLVTRDIDLFTQFEEIQVGVSISTLQKEYYQALEPKAPSPQQRIKALKTLDDANIQTYAFFSPMLPEITDLERVLDPVAPHVDFVMFENLNIRSLNQREIMNFLHQHYKEVLPLYKKLAHADTLHPYWEKVKEKIWDVTSTHNLTPEIEFHHGGF